jgi:hypothetical protein
MVLVWEKSWKYQFANATRYRYSQLLIRVRGTIVLWLLSQCKLFSIICHQTVQTQTRIHSLQPFTLPYHLISDPIVMIKSVSCQKIIQDSIQFQFGPWCCKFSNKFFKHKCLASALHKLTILISEMSHLNYCCIAATLRLHYLNCGFPTWIAATLHWLLHFSAAKFQSINLNKNMYKFVWNLKNYFFFIVLNHFKRFNYQIHK